MKGRQTGRQADRQTGRHADKHRNRLERNKGSRDKDRDGQAGRAIANGVYRYRQIQRKEHTIPKLNRENKQNQKKKMNKDGSERGINKNITERNIEIRTEKQTQIRNKQE